MAQGAAIKRVEIVIESRELQRVLEIVERAGATGYTVIPHVHGKGHRGVRADLGFSDVLKNVLVLVFCPDAVAEAILAEVSRLLHRRAGLVAVTPVEASYGVDKGS